MLVVLGETLDVPVSKDEARGDGALPRTTRRETLRVASDDQQLGAGQDVSGRPESAHAEHPIRHLHRHAREGRRDRYGRGSRKRSQAHGNADAMAGRADARVAGGGVRADTVAGVQLDGGHLGRRRRRGCGVPAGDSGACCRDRPRAHQARERPGDIPRDPRCPQCRQVLYSHKRDSFNNKMQCPRAPSSRRWSCRS